MVAKKKTVKKKRAAPKKAKAVAPVKKEKEHSFYVGIEDPLLKKKMLYESLASYLHMLKDIEAITETRDRKKALLAEFNDQMKVIKADVAALYKLLPKYDIPKPKAKPVEEKPKVEEVKPVEPVVKQSPVNSEIAALEAELAALESKLGSI